MSKRTRFRSTMAALGAAAAIATVGVAAPVASADGGALSGPLCKINDYGYLQESPHTWAAIVANTYKGEQFRRHNIVWSDGQNWAYGHSATSFPNDGYIPTSMLKDCAY